LNIGWTKRTDFGVIAEEISMEGRTVRLELCCGTYKGARPYFTVSYIQKDGRRPQVRKYTPFEARADYLFQRFLQDVTDPAKL